MDTSSSWNSTYSPFATVLGTNHAPSVDEMHRLDELLAEPRTEVSRLKAAIAHAQSVLDALLSQKEKIECYIDVHRALMSPIRQMPFEILARIFVYCLPTDRNAVRSLKEAPLLLTIICRDWRRVAISTPSLWNTLHIYLPPQMSETAFSRRVTGVRTWLDRSGSLPLSISLHVKSQSNNTINADNQGFQEKLKLLIRILGSFERRFSALFLSLPPEDLRYFSNLSMSHFPILRSFRMRDADIFNGHYYVGRNNDLNVPFASLLARMPALRQLEVSEMVFGGSSYLTLALNWGLMTDLSLHTAEPLSNGLIPSRVFSILGRTPNLQSVNICFNLFAPNSASSGTLNLPHLSSLRLKFISFHSDSQKLNRQISSIFRSFSTPLLKLLSVASADFLLSEFPCSNTEIPFHAIDTLELSMKMTPEVLFRWLSDVPGLVTFRFRDMGCPLESGDSPYETYSTFSDSHFFDLTPSPNNPSPLCPRLTTFRMIDDHQHKGPSRITSSALLAFVKARATTLRSFDLFFHQKPELVETDLTALCKLKKSGLEIRLHCAKHPLSEEDLPSSGLHPPLGSIFQPIVRYEDQEMEGEYATDYII